MKTVIVGGVAGGASTGARLRRLEGHAAYYPGTAPLFMKVLFDPAEGKLLGAQVLGWDGVDKRIDVLAVAIRAGMTVYDLEHLELAYAPPYGAAAASGGRDLYITTSWFDCEPDSRAAQPLAGAIFRCRPGVTGPPSSRYADVPASSAPA